MLICFAFRSKFTSRFSYNSYIPTMDTLLWNYPRKTLEVMRRPLRAAPMDCTCRCSLVHLLQSIFCHLSVRIKCIESVSPTVSCARLCVVIAIECLCVSSYSHSMFFFPLNSHFRDYCNSSTSYKSNLEKVLAKVVKRDKSQMFSFLN